MKTNVHLAFEDGRALFYAENKNFPEEYVGSISFKKLSPRTVFMFNAVGRLKRKHYEELERKLTELGFKEVLAYLPTKYVPEGFTPLKGTELHISRL